MRKVYCDKCKCEYDDNIIHKDFKPPVFCLDDKISLELWYFLPSCVDFCYKCRINLIGKLTNIIKEDFKNGEETEN